MRHVARLIVATVVLVGCSEHSPVQPQQPLPDALILDGAHADGNPDFFFLPPLVANPRRSPNFNRGKFNARLSPFVEVCELVDNPILFPTTNCKTGPLVFGPARMVLAGIDDDDPPDLDDDEGHYKLNWDTKASLLTVGRFYRVTVRGAVGGNALGFLDVEPMLGGVKKMKGGDVFFFRDDRTVPIKVRIEQGAFGAGNGADRVEQVVPNVLPSTGLDVTTSTGFAGVHFSNGWLPVVSGRPLDQVVVIIERVPVNNGSPGTSCLNTPLEQLEGCYRFRTDPDLHTLVPGTDLRFAVPAIVGICFQYPADIGSPTGRPFDLYRSEETAEGLAPAQPLPDEVPAPFLRCSGFGPTPPSIPAAFRSGRLGDIAKAGLFALTHAIGRAIQPAALHAVDLGAGGSADGFSRFGWARHATLSATVSAATAVAGSQVQAIALVDNSHNDHLITVPPQPVTFTVTSRGGTLSATQGDTKICDETPTCTVTTNQGSAGVSWRLVDGENTLKIETTQVANSPTFVTAVGTPSVDFTVQTPTFLPTSPTTADAVTLSTVVANAGVSAAPANRVDLCFSNSSWDGVDVTSSCQPQEIPALAGGQSMTVSAAFAGLLEGRTFAYATVDPLNAVSELREDNNTAATSPAFSVFPPGLDQLNDPSTSTSYGCPNDASYFQSFTPALLPVTRVDLRLRTGGSFVPGTSTTINIRNGSPTGDILGTATAVVPAGNRSTVVVPFFFPNGINVPPGTVLVIEWLSPGPLGGATLSWFGSDANPYGGGMAFGCSGNPIPTNDLNFRTFTSTLP